MIARRTRDRCLAAANRTFANVRRDSILHLNHFAKVMIAPRLQRAFVGKSPAQHALDHFPLAHAQFQARSGTRDFTMHAPGCGAGNGPVAVAGLASNQ
jgi:hypothetical protein